MSDVLLGVLPLRGGLGLRAVGQPPPTLTTPEIVLSNEGFADLVLLVIAGVIIIGVAWELFRRNAR